MTLLLHPYHGIAIAIGIVFPLFVSTFHKQQIVYYCGLSVLVCLYVIVVDCLIRFRLIILDIFNQFLLVRDSSVRCGENKVVAQKTIKRSDIFLSSASSSARCNCISSC